MTRFVVVRHGQSVYNLEGRIQGQMDVPLTELGRAQADAAGEFLKDMHFDAAYASDLQRAFETAQRIVAHHPGLEVKPEPELREIYVGKWQGMLSSKALEMYPEEYGKWRRDRWNACAIEGESTQEAAKRAHDAMWRIAKAHPEETVMVASHGGLMHTLLCEWMGEPYERIMELPWIKNAATYIVDYNVDTGKCMPVLLGENSYLDGIDATDARFKGVV